MCKDNSKSMLLECGRECSFSEVADVEAHKTSLHKLTSAELENLPPNNNPSECIFSAFNRKAQSAKCQNQKFKAKTIQNDMTLH